MPNCCASNCSPIIFSIAAVGKETGTGPIGLSIISDEIKVGASYVSLRKKVVVSQLESAKDTGNIRTPPSEI